MKVDLFSACEFFIDCISSSTGSDQSLRLANEWKKKYGLRIVDQPRLDTTTHVIFKNGQIQTRVFAQKKGIPLLDPAWIDDCLRKKCLLPVENYRVSEERNVNPRSIRERKEKSSLIV